MEKNKSALLVGGNFINKGAEAMLLTVARNLRKQDPSYKIYAICMEFETEIAKKFGITVLAHKYSFFDKTIGKFVKKILSKLRIKEFPFADITPVDKLHQIKNLKYVIDVSGYAYHDGRGFQQPLESLKIFDHFPKNSFQYIFMPQAWGSFKHPKLAENCRELIKRSNRYYARDNVSRRFLSQLLSIPETNINLRPDIAFTFDTIKEKDLTPYLKSFNKKGNSRIFGISPNIRIYEKESQNIELNSYGNLLLEVIGKLIHDGHKILIIPNEILSEKGQVEKDDLFLCQELFQKLSERFPEQVKNNTIVSANQYLSAYEVKYIISQVDFLISSRFHSLIFSLSQGIPSLSISWSHKYLELFKLFGQDNLVVEDIDMTTEKVYELCNYLIENEEKLKREINDTLPILQKSLEDVLTFN